MFSLSKNIISLLECWNATGQFRPQWPIVLAGNTDTLEEVLRFQGKMSLLFLRQVIDIAVVYGQFFPYNTMRNLKVYHKIAESYLYNEFCLFILNNNNTAWDSQKSFISCSVHNLRINILKI